MSAGCQSGARQVRSGAAGFLFHLQIERIGHQRLDRGQFDHFRQNGRIVAGEQLVLVHTRKANERHQIECVLLALLEIEVQPLEHGQIQNDLTLGCFRPIDGDRVAVAMAFQL